MTQLSTRAMIAVVIAALALFVVKLAANRRHVRKLQAAGGVSLATLILQEGALLTR